jgi:hypothetical protein
MSERSTLPKDEARRRYVELGELAVLEQIREDSQLLDAQSIAVGPFARLDAGAVAAHDGKTRGAVTNLFGSQAAFQVETMGPVLSVAEELEAIELPAPEAYATADEWLDAFFTGESDRGPQHGAEPAVSYATLWALWLSTVPYGIWSRRVQEPAMEEWVGWVARLEREFSHALEHFGMRMRGGTTVHDLACAVASLVDGVWLNQCLTGRHPTDAKAPIAELLRRSGPMLWRGATEAGDA